MLKFQDIKTLKAVSAFISLSPQPLSSPIQFSLRNAAAINQQQYNYIPYSHVNLLFSSALLRFLHFTANKKAKLIINGGGTPYEDSNAAFGSQSYSSQGAGAAASAAAAAAGSATERPVSRPGGPNLVNKQLVLPFVPPSFPNGSASDGSNHLIKPSEYLKSISDKRSSISSAR